MEQEIIVSICIPAYKRADFLERCLDSILQQSFQQYEIVITDDSPTDELKSLSGKDERIVYVKNEQPLGSPANWNKAISLARGKYIKIMHHDDWFSSPDALSRFVQALEENPSSLFAFSASRQVGKDNVINRPILIKKISKLSYVPEILYDKNYIGAPSVTIFRNNLGLYFDERLIWLVDTEFYIRMLRMNKHFTVINEPLIDVGLSEFQITNDCIENSKLVIGEYLYMFKKLSLERNVRDYIVLLDKFALYNIFTNEDIMQAGIDATLSSMETGIICLLKLKQNIIRYLKQLKRALV